METEMTSNFGENESIMSPVQLAIRDVYRHHSQQPELCRHHYPTERKKKPPQVTSWTSFFRIEIRETDPREYEPWRVTLYNQIFGLKWFIFVAILLIVDFVCLVSYDVLNPDADRQNDLLIVDTVISVFLVAEVGVKLVLGQKYYLDKAWNYIEVISTVFIAAGLGRQKSGLTVFRMFRMLKIARLFTFLGIFHNVLNGVVTSLPKLRNNVIFLLFFTTLMSIGATEFFMCSLDNRCVQTTFTETEWFNRNVTLCACDSQYHSLYKNAEPFVMKPEIACKLDCNSKGVSCPDGFVCLRLKDASDDGFTGFDNFVLSASEIFRMVSLSNWCDVFARLARAEGLFVSAMFSLTVVFFLNFTILNIFVATLSAMFKDVRSNSEYGVRREGVIESSAITSDPLKFKDSVLAEKVFDTLSPTSPLNHLIRKNVFNEFDDVDVILSKMKKRSLWQRIHAWCAEITSHKRFELASCMFILYSVAVTSSVTPQDSKQHQMFVLVSDILCNIIFSIEIVIRLIVAHPNYLGYIRKIDNSFDIVVVLIGWICLMFNLTSASFLRSFRVIRALRLAEVFTTLSELVKHSLDSIPSIGNLILLIFVLIGLFGVAGYHLFGGQLGIHDAKLKNPSISAVHANIRENFDTYMRSLLTLFQVLTGEDWDSIMIVFTKELHWFAPAYFILFFFLSQFIFLGLFTALILESFEMSTAAKLEAQENIFVSIFEKTQRRKERFIHIIIELYHRRLPLSIIRQREEEYSRIMQQQQSQKSLAARKHRVSATKILGTKEPLKFSVEPTPLLSLMQCMHQTDDKIFFGSFVKETKNMTEHAIEEVLHRMKSGESVCVEPFITCKDPPQQRIVDNNSVDTFADDVDSWVNRVVKVHVQKESMKVLLRQNTATTSWATMFRFNDFGSNPCCLDEMGWSLIFFGPSNVQRKYCLEFLSSKLYQVGIVLVILLSTLALVVEDPHEANINREIEREKASWQHQIDQTVISIFIIEAGLKIFAQGMIFHPNAYFMDVWNIFDFVLLVGMVPSMIQSDDESVRVLRVLRVVRPVRSLQHVPGIDKLTNALWNAKWSILCVLVFSMFIIYCFSLSAVWLFGGRLQRCNTYIPLQPLKRYFPIITFAQECVGLWVHGDDNLGFVSPMAWHTPIRNFDTAPQSFITLLEVASLSAWKEVMYFTQDITEIGQQPIPYVKSYYASFFVLFIIVALYLVNLTVGVIIEQISIARGVSLLSDKQIAWTNQQRAILRQYVPVYNPIYNSPDAPWLYRDILNPNSKVDNLVSFVIIANVGLLACIRRGNWNWDEWPLFVNLMNVGFLLFYIAEICVKVKVMGWKTYRGTGWGKFDLILVFLNVCATPVDFLGFSKDSSSEVLRAISVLARILRLARAFKLMNKIKILRWLADTLRMTLLDVLRVAALLLVVVLLAIITGKAYFTRVRFFGPPGSWDQNSPINADFNFRSFSGALLIVMRCLTLDGWDTIMRGYAISPSSPEWCTHDSEMNDCGSRGSFVYFTSLFIIGGWIFLNLLVAVIVDAFLSSSEDFPGVTQQELDEVGIVWSQFDKTRSGKLRRHEVRLMLHELKKRYPRNKLNLLGCKDERYIMTMLNMTDQADTWMNSSLRQIVETEMFQRMLTLSTPILSVGGMKFDDQSPTSNKNKISFQNVLLILTQHVLPDDCLTIDEQFYRLHLYFAVDQYYCITIVQSLFKLRKARIRTLSAADGEDSVLERAKKRFGSLIRKNKSMVNVNLPEL